MLYYIKEIDKNKWFANGYQRVEWRGETELISFYLNGKVKQCYITYPRLN